MNLNTKYWWNSKDKGILKYREKNPNPMLNCLPRFPYQVASHWAIVRLVISGTLHGLGMYHEWRKNYTKFWLGNFLDASAEKWKRKETVLGLISGRQTERRTDRQNDGGTDGRMDRWMEGWVDRFYKIHYVYHPIKIVC